MGNVLDAMVDVMDAMRQVGRGGSSRRGGCQGCKYLQRTRYCASCSDATQDEVGMTRGQVGGLLVLRDSCSGTMEVPRTHNAGTGK
jgi:hypothetical protein